MRTPPAWNKAGRHPMVPLYDGDTVSAMYRVTEGTEIPIPNPDITLNMSIMK